LDEAIYALNWKELTASELNNQNPERMWRVLIQQAMVGENNSIPFAFSK